MLQSIKAITFAAIGLLGQDTLYNGWAVGQETRRRLSRVADVGLRKRGNTYAGWKFPGQ